MFLKGEWPGKTKVLRSETGLLVLHRLLLPCWEQWLVKKMRHLEAFCMSGATMAKNSS